MRTRKRPADVETDQRVYDARDLLLDSLETHVATCADAHCQHAVALAAFIAHALGVSGSRAINTMIAELERYNRECPGCTERN